MQVPPKMSTQQEIRASILVGLRAGHTTKEISEFSQIPLRMVSHIKAAYDGDLEGTISTREQQNPRSDQMNNIFVGKVQDMVDEDPERSMRSISRELPVAPSTVGLVVTENIWYKSYSLSVKATS